MTTKGTFSIGGVARRTGLTPPLIRMWEARYGAVTPDRSDSGQRRYSEADVRRLELLRALVDSGRRIGLVAGLATDDLEKHVAALRRPTVRLVEMRPPETLGPAIGAIRSLDSERFRATLDEAALRLGNIEMLERFLAPLMREIGERCASGDLRMVHEHLATAEVRGFLDGVAGAFPASPGAPALVAGTPAWQHHELGSLLVAAAARAEGWRVAYLGPNLPAAELATAAIEVDASAVALSLTYVDEPGRLLAELATLRRLLPDGVELIVGGGGASGLSGDLAGMGVLERHSLAHFREELGRLRMRSIAV